MPANIPVDIKNISPLLSVSSQIYPTHMGSIASLGFRTIINNRPDGEADDQPLAHELAAEAAKNGMILIYQPVISGKVSVSDSIDFVAELKRARGPVLAFCRSGLRCTALWALNEARYTNADVVLSFAMSIGFDLKNQRKHIEKIARQANHSGRG